MEILRHPLRAVILLAALIAPLVGSAQDGRRDPSFQPRFRTPRGLGFATVNADGSYLISGGFDRVLGEPRQSLARLQPDGTLDPGFVPRVPRSTQAAVRQSDGRVVCAELSPESGRLFRLTADGTLDPSFVGPPSATGYDAYSLLELTAGDSLLISRTSAAGERILRLLPNGAEDPTFYSMAGTEGFERIYGVQPLPNGSTLVWGDFRTYQGLGTPGVARLRPDGTADPAFRSMLLSESRVQSAGTSGDGGALVITSDSTGSQVLVRLTATGAVASSFPANNPLGSRIQSWVPRAGGTRAIRSTAGVSLNSSVAVLDLRADGSVERTTAYSVALAAQINLQDVTPEGIPVFTEFSGDVGGGALQPGFERLLRLVPGASAPEVIGSSLGSADTASIFGLSPAADGRVLVWGSFRLADGVPTLVAAAVLRLDGTWDPAAVAGLGVWDGRIFQAVAHPSGGWVLAGSFRDGSSAPTVALLRVDAAGQVDPAWLAAERSRGLGSVQALAASPAGILVYGRLPGNQPRFVRIRADGTDDPAFRPNVPPDFDPRALEVLPDGRIYGGPRAASTNDTVGTVARLLPDGQADASFDRTNARVARNFAARPDGSIVLITRPDPTGDRQTEGEPRVRLRGLRLFADGSIDPTFAPRERFDGELTGFRRLRDGRFLIDGTFLAIGERSRFGLARLTADGELDAGFRPELPVGPPFDYIGVSQQTGAGSLVELPSGNLLVAPRAGPDPLLKLLVDPQPAASGRGRGQLANVSSRGRVESGDRVMIAGFVVAGGPRRVVVRALGPSLAAAGVPGTLANPSLEVFSGGTSLAANDDWATSDSAAEVSAAGLAPFDAREAAVALTLPPGNYTTIVRGAGGATGVGIVEVYVLDAPGFSSPPPAVGAPRAVNLSTRAFVGQDDNVLIGGFIIRGGSARVALRGLGPTLGGAGVPGTLADPFLRVVRSVDGRQVFASDSWQQQQFGLGNTQPLALPTPTPAEIGTVLDLPEGDYTVIISGVGSGTGIGMFEVYELPDNGTP